MNNLHSALQKNLLKKRRKLNWLIHSSKMMLKSLSQRNSILPLFTKLPSKTHAASRLCTSASAIFDPPPPPPPPAVAAAIPAILATAAPPKSDLSNLPSISAFAPPRKSSDPAWTAGSTLRAEVKASRAVLW
eukprot:CAMPEP_0183302746 /NCGR_PEP_ID=MMETSP0160_2-20130417/8427_1 /TAXON_ID=2839 ORGANISM="Odontella Sinensis, Strain Grunow 1884" /NCGR_SAMPLE_ID=MMETSP0160_2 /ASSEMBLY_ACC=CAM_ASM_000250 /LENGTH=131 /DNA_ID=CAMNT_0025465557 /DNA_START=192 /DNA_END=584 /DNA_ORIENTATION=+